MASPAEPWDFKSEWTEFFQQSLTPAPPRPVGGEPTVLMLQYRERFKSTERGVQREVRFRSFNLGTFLEVTSWMLPVEGTGDNIWKGGAVGEPHLLGKTPGQH